MMKKILDLISKAYRFRKAAKQCKKHYPQGTEEHRLALFYREEIEKWEDDSGNRYSIDWLKKHAADNREKYQQSEPISEMLVKLDLFLEALRPLA